jgi:hypothetical protein
MFVVKNSTKPNSEVVFRYQFKNKRYTENHIYYDTDGNLMKLINYLRDPNSSKEQFKDLSLFLSGMTSHFDKKTPACILAMCIDDDRVVPNEYLFDLFKLAVEYNLQNKLINTAYPMGEDFCYYILPQIIEKSNYKQLYNSIIDLITTDERFKKHNILVREIYSRIFEISKNPVNINNTKDIIEKMVNSELIEGYSNFFDIHDLGDQKDSNGPKVEFFYDLSEFPDASASLDLQKLIDYYFDLLIGRFPNKKRDYFCYYLVSHPVLRYNKKLVTRLVKDTRYESFSTFDSRVKLMDCYISENENDSNYEYIELLYNLYSYSLRDINIYRINNGNPKTNDFMLSKLRPSMNSFTKSRHWSPYASLFWYGPFMYDVHKEDSLFKKIVLDKSPETIKIAMKHGGNPYTKDHNGNNAFVYVHEQRNNLSALDNDKLIKEKLNVMFDFCNNQSNFASFLMKLKSLL